MHISRYLLLAALLTACCAAWAIPTGLNSMPTAEALPFGTSRIDLVTQGGGYLFVPHGLNILGSQTGILPGLEGGIDEVESIGAVYNLKWVFKGEGLLMPALAVGAQNVVHGRGTQYYLVGTKSIILAKLSAGFLRNHGDTATMLGGSSQLGPFIVKVDHIAGADLTRSSAGLGYAISRFVISATYYDVANAPKETTFMLSYNEAAF